MASVIRKAWIRAPAAECWAALRDFGAVHQRLARGFVASARLLSPYERELTFFTGAVATERLVGTDETLMRLAYTVVDGSLATTHHSASAQVVPDGPGECRFIWVTDVLPDELSEPIGALMDKGLHAIKETLENGASTG